MYVCLIFKKNVLDDLRMLARSQLMVDVTHKRCYTPKRMICEGKFLLPLLGQPLFFTLMSSSPMSPLNPGPAMPSNTRLNWLLLAGMLT